MSSWCDFLMYVSPSDKGLDKFLDAIQAEARFEARPLAIDTSNFNGPNGFMGALYAFGPDYFRSDVQKLLDSIEWSHPEAVVVVTRREGIGGYACDPPAYIFQPKFIAHKDGWSTWITQSNCGNCETCVPGLG